MFELKYLVAALDVISAVMFLAQWYCGYTKKRPSFIFLMLAIILLLNLVVIAGR